jgi:hypothetical protein
MPRGLLLFTKPKAESKTIGLRGLNVSRRLEYAIDGPCKEPRWIYG